MLVLRKSREAPPFEPDLPYAGMMHDLHKRAVQILGQCIHVDAWVPHVLVESVCIDKQYNLFQVRMNRRE